MNRDQFEELLWERIDGTISPGALQELERHLTANPDLRDLEREVGRLAELLDADRQEPAPAELRARIANAINAVDQRPAGVAARDAASGPRATGRSVSTWAAIAASLVVGIAIGFLLHTSISGPIDPAHASGSMTIVATERFGRARSVDLGVGSLELAIAEGSTVIELELEKAGEVEVVVVTAGPPVLALTVAGPASQRLVFDRGDARGVEVRVDGRLTAVLPIDRPPGGADP